MFPPCRITKFLNVYDWYDGPVFFGCVLDNGVNAVLLAISDDFWLMTYVSAERIAAFDQGQVSSRQLYVDTEDGAASVVLLNRDGVIRILNVVRCADLADDMLPYEGWYPDLNSHFSRAR